MTPERTKELLAKGMGLNYDKVGPVFAKYGDELIDVVDVLLTSGVDLNVILSVVENFDALIPLFKVLVNKQ